MCKQLWIPIIKVNNSLSGFPFKDRENFVDFALTKVLERTTRE